MNRHGTEPAVLFERFQDRPRPTLGCGRSPVLA